MLKRILSFSLTVCLLLSLCISLSAGASKTSLTEWETLLTFGETVTIPAQHDGKAILDVCNLFSTPHPEVKTLVFFEGIRMVDTLCLEQLPSLTEVVLPNSLVAIAEGSFTGCDSLTTLTIPSGVLLIHEPEKVFAPHLTLRGERDSYIARYAAYHSLPFEPIVHTASLGDVNADGLCNTSDARDTLQYLADGTMPASFDPSFADVDQNGSVTTTDARRMLQFAAGLSVDCAIAAPPSRPAQTLISSKATVTAYYSAPNKREEAPVRDPASAIRAVNNMVAQNYELERRYLFCLIEERFVFTEPDGVVVKVIRQEHGLPEIQYLTGRVFYGLADPAADQNWALLHSAVD